MQANLESILVAALPTIVETALETLSAKHRVSIETVRQAVVAGTLRGQFDALVQRGQVEVLGMALGR